MLLETVKTSEIGDRVREHRENLGLTREAMALNTSFSAPQLYRLETGELRSEKRIKKMLADISQDDDKLYHYLLYGEKFEEEPSQIEQLKAAMGAGAPSTSTTYPTPSKAKEGEDFQEAMKRFGIDPARDSSENIIQLYFDLYPERKKDLAQLIRQGKFEKVIELLDL
jgi:transcriptional regulator with XRE-family HTH domain